MLNIETYYLIDYENVHADGLQGCRDLGKTDHIVIFFTQNAKSIDMSEISNHGDAELEMIEVPAGKQSADMHIGSYLGYLAGKYGENCKVVIVSKDTDFDNVIKFWKQKTDLAASRTKQIKNKTTPKQQISKQQPVVKSKDTVKLCGANKTKLKQEVLQKMISEGYVDSDANTVAQIAASSYGNEHMLLVVHNGLEARYSNYRELYAVIKPILSKYQNGKDK